MSNPKHSSREAIDLFTSRVLPKYGVPKPSLFKRIKKSISDKKRRLLNNQLYSLRLLGTYIFCEWSWTTGDFHFLLKSKAFVDVLNIQIKYTRKVPFTIKPKETE